MRTLVLHCAFFALIGLSISPLAARASSSSTGQSNEPFFTFYSPDGYIGSMVFSSDGRLLVVTMAVTDDSSEVKLWDVLTGQSIANLTASIPFDSGIFSSDGQRLAFWAYNDPTIGLWDVSRGRQHVATIRAHETGIHGTISEASFSPDGQLLASGGASDLLVKLLDVSTGQSIATLAARGPVSFSPNGRLLASVSQTTYQSTGNEFSISGGQDIELWDVSTGQSIATLPLPSSDSYDTPRELVFFPDGRLLASLFPAGVQLWDVSEWIGEGTIATVEQAMPHTLTKVSGDGQEGTVGEPLAKPFVVSVLDQEGSAFAGAVVSFSVTAGGGTLSATTATTNASGQARSTLTLGPDLGTNTVTATVAALESVIFTAIATDQTPHSLTKVSGDSQAGPASTQLAAPFVVSVLDQNGSPLSGVPVSFSVTAGGGILSATTNPCTFQPTTLSSTTATTDANGQATIRLTLGSNAGTHTVAATVEGLDPLTFTATAAEQASPHRMTKVCGDNQEGIAGAVLDKSFVVSVLAEDGSAIAGVVVSFAITAGGGTLSSAMATTDANGRAATSLTLGSEVGTNTVEATVAGLASVTFIATGQEDPLASMFDTFFGSGKPVALPDHTQLLQNAPNPFNSQTVLSYFLHAPGPARVEVFTLTGQRVALLQQGPQPAGYHRLHWDGRDVAGRPVASGTYLYRLVTDETVLTRKLTLLR